MQPDTEPGRRFVELVEKHAVDFAERADEHDRKGTFPVENIEDLKRSGAMAATVPVQYGDKDTLNKRLTSLEVTSKARIEGL